MPKPKKYRRYLDDVYDRIPEKIIRDIAITRSIIKYPENGNLIKNIPPKIIKELYLDDKLDGKWKNKILNSGFEYLIQLYSKYLRTEIKLYLIQFYTYSFYYMSGVLGFDLNDKIFDKITSRYIKFSYKFFYKKSLNYDKKNVDNYPFEILFIILISFKFRNFRELKLQERKLTGKMDLYEGPKILHSFSDVFDLLNSNIFIPSEYLPKDPLKIFDTDYTDLSKENYIYSSMYPGPLLTNSIEEAWNRIFDLRKYPAYPDADYFKALFMHSDYLNFFVKILVDESLGEILNREEAFFLLTRGYSITNYKTRLERFKNLLSLSDEEIIPILLSHNIQYDPNSDETTSQIAQLEPNVIDKYIFFYHEHKCDVKKISQQAGIIIPPNKDPVKYFLENIWLYKNVLTRNDDITMKINSLINTPQSFKLISQFSDYLTDHELLNAAKLYINYNSRTDLLNKISELTNQKKFFIPLIRNCQNTESPISFEDTNDKDVFIIAYGTLLNYICIDVYDLIDSFVEVPAIQNQPANFIFNTLGEKNKNTYTIDEIQQLQELLYFYTQNPSVKQLYDKIGRGLEIISDLDDYDKFNLRKFRSFNNNVKNLIKQWFIQLFYLGMYMRRWKGPEFPYPITEEETKISFDKEALYQKISYELVKLNNIGEKLPNIVLDFLNKLYITYEKLENNKLVIDRKTNTIGFILNEVNNGSYCIRMASKRLIGSASHYLDVFFNYVIPNFERTNVDEII